jgi:hypothetical protein
MPASLFLQRQRNDRSQGAAGSVRQRTLALIAAMQAAMGIDAEVKS